jgi:hypothetical protein
LARHPAQVCPELVATAPRQVYSWDITKLAGPVKGTYFDAYVMIDIYSRYLVHRAEDAVTTQTKALPNTRAGPSSTQNHPHPPRRHRLHTQ